MEGATTQTVAQGQRVEEGPPGELLGRDSQLSAMVRAQDLAQGHGPGLAQGPGLGQIISAK